jgi:hypothetical protein
MISDLIEHDSSILLVIILSVAMKNVRTYVAKNSTVAPYTFGTLVLILSFNTKRFRKIILKTEIHLITLISGAV